MVSAVRYDSAGVGTDIGTEETVEMSCFTTKLTVTTTTVRVHSV